MTVISVSSISAKRILAEMTDQGTAHTNTHTSSIHSMFSTLSLLDRIRAYLVLTLWRGHQGIRKKAHEVLRYIITLKLVLIISA